MKFFTGRLPACDGPPQPETRRPLEPVPWRILASAGLRGGACNSPSHGFRGPTGCRTSDNPQHISSCRLQPRWKNKQ